MGAMFTIEIIHMNYFLHKVCGSEILACCDSDTKFYSFRVPVDTECERELGACALKVRTKYCRYLEIW